MKKDDKISYSIFAFVIGFILRWTDALDIIHELCHHAWANIEGIEVTSMSWSHITYASSSALVLYGGYMGEFTLYGLLVFFLSIAGKKISASFFLGILIFAWLTSFSSTDFNEYALKLWGSQTSVTRVLWMWGVWSSFWMFIIGKIHFKNWDYPKVTPSKKKVISYRDL